MTTRSEAQIRRILMTGDTVGGVWTFTLDLAKALARYEIEIVLATMGGSPSAAQISEAAAVPNLYLLESDFKLEWMEDPWSDVEAAGRWLMKLRSEFSPDLVHLNTFGHGALPWHAPTLLTAHSCVMSWWEAVRHEPAPASWNRYRMEVTRALDSVDRIAAPSAYMAAALTGHYGVAPAKCTVIPNGRDASAFRRASKEPFILTAGRVWDEAKNVAVLSRIAAALSWPVYVAGDARNLRIDGCRMLGRLPAPELAEWQARAAIYVAPARYEPFGLSILEAALSGCAVVLGDIPSLREIWGDAVLFVAPEDALGLRDAIETLAANASLRESMCERALVRARRLTAERMGHAYNAVYAELVRSRKGQCVL